MQTISLQERFRQAEAICSNMPLGYGWNISLGTDGASVPVFRVSIDKGYDGFLHKPLTEELTISSDSEDIVFAEFISDLEKTVRKLCSELKRKTTDQKKRVSEISGWILLLFRLQCYLQEMEIF